ncbi:MAG TPA: hypothetical protein DCX46_07000 [Bacteroidetes bacterium]|nr:hypothetical protein [Bacteroidota bacterium]
MLIMTGLAFLRFAPCRKPVGEAEVAVMHVQRRLHLPLAECHQAGSMRRLQVVPREIHLLELCSVVAFLAGFFGMARTAVRIQFLGDFSVLGCKIGPIMFGRSKGDKVCMARFAGVRSCDVVVTGVAGGHRRDPVADRRFFRVDAGVTRFARNALYLNVLLM